MPAFAQTRLDNRLTSSQYTVTQWNERGTQIGNYGPFIAPLTKGVYRFVKSNPTKAYKPGNFSVNPVEQVHVSIASEFPTGSSVPLLKDYYPGCWLPNPNANLGNWVGGVKVFGDMASYVRSLANVGFPENPSSAVYPSSLLVDAALIQAKVKINAEDFGTALFLAELRETIGMLRNPLQGFRKLYNEFIQSSRKMSKYGGKTLTDSLSSQWMEYRYGITPLIKDIAALMELYEKGITSRTKPMERVKRRILGGSTTPTYSQEQERMMTNSGVASVVFREQRFEETAIVAKFFYRRTCDLAEKLARMGLSPQQLVTIPWELVPLSFVVDWVVGVGDWLSSITPLIGVDILGNTVSYKVTQKSVIQVLRGRYAYHGRYTWADMSKYRSVQTIDSYVRLTNLPEPALPALQPDIMNLKRSIDSLSLIWQNVPKIRTRR